MPVPRVDRLNSLLKEVISDVIRKEIHHKEIDTDLITVTRVDITKDLHYAKVLVSIMSGEKEKKTTLEVLQKAAGRIAVLSSKKVVMRFFPSLTFKLDDGLDNQMKVEELLKNIEDEREGRQQDTSEEGLA